MSDQTWYITTPLYYVNAKPHIGHAYTNVLCDTFARWRRFNGQKVFFLTGTDEHGTKIEKIAKAEGKAPRDFADQIVPEFKKLWEVLGIQYDFFIRTTDEEHKNNVAAILRDLEARGEIYKAAYKGWYCTPCESFWTDLQLKEGKCPDCSREVQELSEENYFFKLSKYQDWLIQYIQDHPGFIRPDYRKNEILGFLRQPLEDLSITRPKARLTWGIDYPNSPEHVVYVWFDALINYVSAVGYPDVEKKYGKNLWPADIHVVGKDILRQHAVYWPIMLKAMNLELPKTVLAHGWWTMSGAKVSKSRGNAVDPIELTKKYGVDAFRYFLLHEVTVGQDGAFSEDLLAERYTTNLANDLGNLWFRVASMIEKYFEKKIPESGYKGGENFAAIFQSVAGFMENQDPRKALESIWPLFVQSNQLIDEKKPWVMAKDPARKEELGQLLTLLTDRLVHAAYLLVPFLPGTAAKILNGLQFPTDRKFSGPEEFAKPLLSPGMTVERGEALFPRLEETEKDKVSGKK